MVQCEQFARYFMQFGFTIFSIVTLVDLNMLGEDGLSTLICLERTDSKKEREGARFSEMNERP